MILGGIAYGTAYCRKKGKGKTKIVLDMVNKEIATVSGNIVYLDKGNDHMYELNNKVRLINVEDYGVASADEFIGFIRGIVSQDHDLEQIYFDGFLRISCLEDTDRVEEIINKLDSISNTYGFKIIISISIDEAELPESLKSKVIVSL